MGFPAETEVGGAAAVTLVDIVDVESLDLGQRGGDVWSGASEVGERGRGSESRAGEAGQGAGFGAGKERSLANVSSRGRWWR